MEDVIVGLLFVYFFFIRPVLKQARKRSATAKDRGTRPPLGVLIDVVREKMKQIAEEAEAVRREKASRRPAGPRQEMFEAATREPAPEQGAVRVGTGESDSWWPREPWVAEEVGVVSPDPPGAVLEKTPPSPLPSAAASGPRPALGGVPTGLELRQAVVWAEILGPPVSLRDGG